MSKRRCPTPGCPHLIPAGTPRCPQHQREHEAQRGSRQARGYDRNYDRERRHWAGRIRQGDISCWRCRQPIRPDEPWDLGHDDNDRTIIRGPEHQHCNRSAAGKTTHPQGVGASSIPQYRR